MNYLKHIGYIAAFVLFVPLVVLAQSSGNNISTSSPVVNYQQEIKTTSTSTQPLSNQKDITTYLNSLDSPKIIKNNLRISKIIITDAHINNNDEIIITGKAEIKNSAPYKSSKLYMSSFTGIKGNGYFLQYPLYTTQRSDAFEIESGQTITKDFTITENNFLNFGKAAVEIWITDEYNKRNHAEIAYIPQELINQNDVADNVFSDFKTTLKINDQNFSPNTGPTFYPDTENMFFSFDFGTTTPTFLTSVDIKIFKRDLFTTPIKQYNERIIDSSQSAFDIAVPKDLPPGVYPFELSFVSNDSTIFIPHIYGRFIVGGNMAKTLDVSIPDSSHVNVVTVTVQGNPRDIVDSERENPVTFDATISILDKKDAVLFTQKLTNQSVTTYRNIDVALGESIDSNKIYKIKIELNDEKGIFDTYTKEFEHSETFNYWNLLYILGGIILLLIILRFKKKKIITTTALMFVFFVSMHSVASADMTPIPTKSFGAFIYNVTNPSVTSRIDKDIKDFAGDSLLSDFGINLSYIQPITVEKDSSYCYAPGQVIPVVFDFSYGICTNSPVTTCTGTGCVEGTNVLIDNYADIYLAINPGNWYFNLRDWDVDWNHFTDSSYDEYDSYFTIYPNKDLFKDFDPDYLFDYIKKVATQSNNDTPADHNTVRGTNGRKEIAGQNTQRINEIEDDLFSRFITSDKISIDIETANYRAFGSDSNQYSIVAPEKPGTYNLYSKMYFHAKQGNGYYFAQHQIKICNTKHDADYLMSGIQTIDTSGNLRNEGGGLLSGYTIQKYPILPGKINGWADEITNDDGDVIGFEGEIDGFNDSPYNEFSFVTTANYCGSKDISFATYRGPKYLSNDWINYFTYATDLSQKLGINTLTNAMSNLIPQKTQLSIFAFGISDNKYISSADSSNHISTVSLDDPRYGFDNFIVHYDNNMYKFINLNNPLLPISRGQSYINVAYNLNNLSSLAYNTFEGMLSNGRFNLAGYIASTTPNLQIVKEDIVNSSNTKTTCSLYKDFCPDVDGIQYLIDSGRTLQLRTFNTDGTKSTATSTSYNSPLATVEAMCNAVGTPPVEPPSVTCSVTSPSTPDRNINTLITFKATATNLNLNMPVTYSWEGATANQSDATLATKKYTTTGTKSDVSINVLNDGKSVWATCPVDIVAVPPSQTVSCVADPVQVAPEEYTTFISTLNPPQRARIKWTNSTGTILSTAATLNQKYSVAGSYQMTVTALVGRDTISNTCSVTVIDPDNPGDAPVLTDFSFDPKISPIPPPPPVYDKKNPNDSYNMCKLNLNIDNVTECKLYDTAKNTTLNISSLIIDYKIFTSKVYGIPIGTFTLKCKGTDNGATEFPYGTPQQCISLPNIKEQ